MAWQPIETAPIPKEMWESSDMILVWNGEDVLPCVIRTTISGQDFEDRSSSDRDGDYANIFPHPTHWMPLPEGPTA